MNAPSSVDGPPVVLTVTPANPLPPEVIVPEMLYEVVVGLFPYYQKVYRGENYEQAAHTLLQRTAGHALYTTNVSASGLSVAAYINIARLPQPPLVFPPAAWSNGYVIAYAPDPKLGVVAAQYRLGGNDLYLLCRGTACNPGQR